MALNELNHQLVDWLNVDSPADARIRELPRRATVKAVHDAVTYADIFDFPLTRREIERYLPAPGGSWEDVNWAVDALLSTGVLEESGEYLFLSGRMRTATRRRARLRHTEWTWKRARGYARLIWMIPSVRMVAVTGSLAVGNLEWNGDIDLFVITKPGRLWTTRGIIVLITRLAAVRGDRLCPNYLITSRVLSVDVRDFYSAHELTQMVPLYGTATASRFFAENAWYRDFLPNAACRTESGYADDLAIPLRLVRGLGGLVMSLGIMDRLERWERRRKIAKLSASAPAHEREVRYGADVCKGHDRGHAARILDLWEQRTGRGTTTS